MTGSPLWSQPSRLLFLSLLLLLALLWCTVSSAQVKTQEIDGLRIPTDSLDSTFSLLDDTEVAATQRFTVEPLKVSPPRTITVIGSATQTIESDEVTLRVTIEARREFNDSEMRMIASTPLTGEMRDERSDALQLQAQAVRAVTAQISRRTNDVVTYLHSLQRNETRTPEEVEMTDRNAFPVHDVHTTSIAVMPFYMYREGRQTLVGYTASTALQITANKEEAAPILAQLIMRGVTRIDGVSFIASAAVVKRQRYRTLRIAVKDAFQQATSIVNSIRLSGEKAQLHVQSLTVIGLTVPGPVGVSVEESDVMTQQARFYRRGSLATVESVPVHAGKQNVAATVLVRFSF